MCRTLVAVARMKCTSWLMKMSVPSILLERANESVDRADIQMRRRLVHEQEVRRIEQKLNQRQPRFLAAAEHTDRFENIVAAKKK